MNLVAANCLSQLPNSSAPHNGDPTALPSVNLPLEAPKVVPVAPAPTSQKDPIPSLPVPQNAPQPKVGSTQTSAAEPFSAMPAYNLNDPDEHSSYGSTYIPLDSWVYPAMTRLYSLGYADTMFLGMRPWTRLSVLGMVEDSEDRIRNSDDEQAMEILTSIKRELSVEVPRQGGERGLVYGPESYYTRMMGISGSTLRDSYHLGQTLVNDYGRPYQPGFNSLLGFSTVIEKGRFSLFVRGEYEHSPSAVGYSQALTTRLTTADLITVGPSTFHQATIPTGPIAAANPFRLLEATLSFHLAGHEISGGKSDAWQGPAQGGAMSWSNNAEDIYSFRINRVEPLHVPYLSALLGPMRYDFFYGSLKGHTQPNHPYVHSEMFSFRPTNNFEFAFQRTIVFGGAGHSPVTTHTFLKGFFSFNDTSAAVKDSREDPGARFSDFTASYRLPLLREYATFYVDSETHDDVTPISAPRRADYRTGLYLSQVPGMRRLDFRIEAVSTDPRVRVSQNGEFAYYETIQRQAYTNKGFIFGDWIGREAKGGQAWLTYHLSGEESVQLEYLHKKNAKDFVGGTTQNQFKIQMIKRLLHDDLELNVWMQYERWKAPLYMTGPQSNTTGAVQLTYFPHLRSRPF